MLSPAEIDAYHRDGVVIPRFRLAPEKLARLRAVLADLLAANPDVRPEQLVSAHIAGKNPEGVVGRPEFLELARDPDILDLVEAVIGPNIILWGCHVFCKPGGDGMEVPWHQDGHYWPIHPLATCTVWLALDDSLPENGCLRVIPGSHRDQERYGHHKETRAGLTLNQSVMSDFFDESTARDVVLEAGQMSLHDVYLIHGSNPNRSDKRRAGVALRYMPASSHFHRDLIAPGDGSGFRVDFSTRPLWLLRGEDVCGLNDFEVGHG